MNVNETELWLRMAQMAAQLSQGSLPQVGVSSGKTGEKSQFQTMMEDKKAQTESSKLDQKPTDRVSEQKEPAQKPAEDGGQTETDAPAEGVKDHLTAELAAALLAAGVPVQVPAAVQESQAEESPAGALPLMAEVLPTAEQPQTGEATVVLATPIQEAPAQETAQTVPLQVRSEETSARPEGTPGQNQQTIQPVAQEKPEVRSGTVEVRTSGRQTEDTPDQAAVQEAGGRPLFRGVEATPVKVGEAPVLDTTSDQMEADLSRTLMGALEQGQQNVELRLSPEHLGTLTVELTRGNSGVLQVVLRTESEQAAHLLREHASTLSMMLQSSGQGEVRIEVPQPRESERPWQQPDQQGGQQEHGQSRQQEQQHRREETEDFLHQLRLGLFQTEWI